ncbi:MAG: hypothetical protein V3571_13325 [Pseudodesulfovibrio sp.]
MRRLYSCLLLVLVALSFSFPARAQESVLTILYSANTYGVIKPCPS